MAKDPTQGPVSTYDEFGNPIKANVDAPVEEVAVEETVEETAEEVAEDVATPPDLPENYEGGTEPVEPAVEEAEEEAAEVEETLWDRLTLVGAESDPEKGETQHVEFTCDRCGETKQGMILPEGTVGFYSLEDALVWAKYANEGEEILCDACMQSDERYLADYPASSEEAEAADEEIERAEVGDETEKMPKEEDDPAEEEEEFVTHEHEVKPPLTYNEAETMLMETSFVKLREMAVADGIKPERSRVKVMRQLLDLWFPAPTSAPADDEPEMSVRIRRAKGLM